MDNEEDYEVAQERLQKENEQILADFINVTVGEQKKGKHKMNQAAEHLRFFANEYLADYQNSNLLEGLECFSFFIGDWFIRKCMWSDEKSVRENLNAFRLFLAYLKGTQLVSAERVLSMEGILKEGNECYLLRAKYYAHPDIELEDIMNEMGDWNDEAMLALAGKKSPTRQSNQSPAPAKEPSTLSIHILFSAAAARFLKLKPPHLTSLRDWGDWDDPSHHWTSNWRCEECFSMTGTKERVFIVSNQNSRYSFLFRIAPSNIDGFFTDFNKRLLEALKEHGVATPRTVTFNLTALSGAARSLTSFQNGQRGHLGAILDHNEFKHLGEVEDRLNQVPSTIPNHPKGYEFPDQQFAKLCQEDSPFPQNPPSDNILQFPN